MTVGTEFVTTSITADNPYGADLAPLRLLNPHIRHFDHRHGYTRCTLTRDRWQTEFLAVVDVTDPAGDVTLQASFVVEAGVPGASRA